MPRSSPRSRAESSFQPPAPASPAKVLNMEASEKCYKRALAHNDREGIALVRLARLLEEAGRGAEAAEYYALNLARLDELESNGEGKEKAAALVYLAQHCKAAGDFSRAEAFCARLLDFGGPEKEVAKSLMQELQQLQGAGRVCAPLWTG